MVDILSGGRLDVGVGRGNRPVEFEGYRVPQIESRERFEEALTILVRAWTLERFAYEGRHYTIPEVRVIPKPLQQPHPPLYVVCVSPDTIEATALRGLPMLNSLLRGPIDQLAQQRDTYVKACRKAGRDDAEVARLLGSWGVFRAMAERLGKITWDQLVAETVAFGAPDTVAEKIDELRRLGVGEVLCWMNFGGLPQEHVRRSMELFAREVMPGFR